MFFFNLSRLEAELRTPAEEVLTQIGGLAAADGVPVNFTQEGDILHFDAVTITRELTIKAK